MTSDLGLTRAERALWRELAWALAASAPTARGVAGLRRLGERARKIPVPEPRDEARMRLFSEAAELAKAYAPERAERARQLAAEVLAIVGTEAEPEPYEPPPREPRKDLFE